MKNIAFSTSLHIVYLLNILAFQKKVFKSVFKPTLCSERVPSCTGAGCTGVDKDGGGGGGVGVISCMGSFGTGGTNKKITIFDNKNYSSSYTM